jgi:hypothetical protein
MQSKQCSLILVLSVILIWARNGEVVSCLAVRLRISSSDLSEELRDSLFLLICSEVWKTDSEKLTGVK